MASNVKPIRPVTKTVTLPAPVRGWNARDSLADMRDDFAVTLLNYFPSTTSVNLRYGYSQFATGMSGQCETVIAYAGTNTDKLFSANSGGRIYNITAGGAIGSADVTGLTNGRWQFINVATTANNYLMGVNGADKARFYTGSAWAADGDGAPYNITGVNSANCIDIELFKNRVWLVQNNTLLAWYLPTAAIGGAANSLDLRAFARRGGYLVAAKTWTLDAGYGMDDHLAFITNKGEVIVYRGTDPSSSTTWALVGVFEMGSPVGIRPSVKWEGDLLIISQDGIQPLSVALETSRMNPKSALTYNIQNAISSAVSNYGSNFGWQILPFPKQNMLILNVPVAAGSSQEQYVMNTITGAWAQFQSWTANCWELYKDNAYFGANTYVGQAWNTNSDNSAAIAGLIIQAFSPFGAPAQRKRATVMRPYILTNGVPQVQANLNWEFDTSNPTSPLSFTATTYGIWDTSLWDTGLWGTDVSPSYALQGVQGSGHYGAPVFKTSSSGLQIQYVSSDLTLEYGGFL